MERSDLPYVEHMLDAIERIESYLTGVDRETFDKDPILQDALVRQLEVLGEAAGRVSPERTSQHTEIPWSKITGMRHKLIHDYFVVDLDVVWTSAIEDVPLKPLLSSLHHDLVG